jgi:molecular chaperone GrpE
VSARIHSTEPSSATSEPEALADAVEDAPVAETEEQPELNTEQAEDIGAPAEVELDGVPSDEAAPEDKPPKLPPLAPILGALRAELATKDEQLKSYITAYKQATADMERERTRLERDRERTADRDRMNMVNSLLDVLDNFSRSLASCRAGGSDAELLTGLELVHKQFLDALKALGAEPMLALLGQTFDPALHEATGMVPASGDQADQEIIFEERSGYTFGGQLLRPARVVVASKPA